MEDSIEDYIRISKNAEDKKEATAKINQQQLLATAQRKKECETYALKVVEFLIEGKLKSEIFLRCLKYINPEYYQDVVEERSLAKLCGYSLCGKKIPDMPKQKYIILSKANKVYEITDRKNYCSNYCYKASLHVKKQLDSSPLWLRNHNETSMLNLLPSSETGSPGEFIDQGIIKSTTETETTQFTSISQFAQYSLEEVADTEKKKKITNKKLKVHRRSLNVINENEESEVEIDDDSSSVESTVEEITKKIDEINIKTTKIEEKVETNQSTKINKEDKEKLKSMNQKEKLEYLKKKLKINKDPKTKLVEPQPLRLNKTKLEAIKEVTESTQQENKNVVDENLLKLKNYIFEWLTIDTFIFVYGEKRVKEILNEKKLLDCFDKLKISELNTQQQLKYMEICRRLQMQEIAEERFDKVVIDENTDLKPLPDYKKLKEESKELDLKVKAFYGGNLYEREDKNFPSQCNKENEDKPAILPLVEVHSQNALRQRVFFNSINKILKKQIQDFKLGGNGVLSDIHDLVRTFKLQAHNIVFKPTQWNVICVILLDMLSIKDSNLRNKLQDARRKAYVHLLTNKISGSELFFKEVMKTIEDVDGYVESYITNNQ
nr:RNA polymerase II subunit B1 CTD phosphatase Rpap2 [Onthophagus taurus]